MREKDLQWTKASNMRQPRAEQRMVAYKSSLFAVGGWVRGGGVHASTEWFANGRWSKRPSFYGDWAVSVSCMAADPENELIYSVGGYSPR